jgi:hypothetical protein
VLAHVLPAARAISFAHGLSAAAGDSQSPRSARLSHRQSGVNRSAL